MNNYTHYRNKHFANKLSPTSNKERIREIDDKSSGFLYCVSVTGTTGARSSFSEDQIKSIDETYKSLENNKMLIGFGISSGKIIKEFSPYCDGVIVASVILKSMLNESDSNNYENTFRLISELNEACNMK